MITPEILQQISLIAASYSELNEAALDALKRIWPNLRFTFCCDDDMPARLPPILQHARFNLYLVSGSEHCLSLTNDPAQAIGVVLAWVDADD